MEEGIHTYMVLSEPKSIINGQLLDYILQDNLHTRLHFEESQT